MTVPVAAVGETVAVSVTVAPSAGVVVEAIRVVVVAVAFQKLPQPASSEAIPSMTSIIAIPVPKHLFFIESPCAKHSQLGE
jgi:hypothetical protein